MKNLKFGIIIFFVSTIFSCKSDDEISLSHKLVGEWLRTDFSDEIEFKLIFNADNVGYRTFKTATSETEITSSAIHFNWSTDENILTFSELDEAITTSFSFNSEGELILKDYSDLPFIRIE
ncbi:hypothetical protein [Lutibacter flavus]|uniref:Lipocalin-like domain-containing protein n=1 Tax=Lutibacter flavus TaxID=691689 RepID=A0A238Y7T3_9FLAO|nr:hypothetical protein [Lutibacter flavus]SNR66654.1 hypothetical protein SAMN04488111_2321 [Lutibacter flavus]